MQAFPVPAMDPFAHARASGFSEGLQAGSQAVANRHRQDAMTLARRRAAIEEADQIRKETLLQQSALRLQRQMDEEDAWRESLNQSIAKRVAILPEELQHDESAVASAMRQGYRDSMKDMPAAMAAKALESEMRQAEITGRNEANIQGRFDALSERMGSMERMADTRAKAVVDSAGIRADADIYRSDNAFDAILNKMASDERIAAGRGTGRTISRDEFIARNLVDETKRSHSRAEAYDKLGALWDDKHPATVEQRLTVTDILPAGGTNVPAVRAVGKLPTVTTKAEFESLKSGDRYLTKSGRPATKP